MIVTILSKEACQELLANEAYKEMTSKEIVSLQLHQMFLCVPKEIFKDALKDVFGRDITDPELHSAINLRVEFAKIVKDESLT